MTRSTKKWKKIATTERFTLHQDAKDPTTFSVRWRKSDNHYGSRRFQAPSVEEAQATAPVVAGLEARKRGLPVVTLAEAFNECLSQASRGPKSTYDWRYFTRRFLKWLAGNQPDCRHWHLLTRQVAREYLDSYKGKSDTMRRLAMQPIAQTSAYMHREYGFVNFAERLGTGAKLQKSPSRVFLEDVVSFCDFLHRANPRLEVGIALQGLVGLQLQEATRLTWDHVDLEHGIVEISGTVKNEYRNRVIPVCKRAFESLRDTYNRQGPQPKGAVLRSPKGFAYGDSWINYSKEVVQALKTWNPKVDWKPKDLRNCLTTFAVCEGIMSDWWEQYVGHAPKTIAARHYLYRLAAPTQGEQSELERRMELLRQHVTRPIDAAILQMDGSPEARIVDVAASSKEGAVSHL